MMMMMRMMMKRFRVLTSLPFNGAYIKVRSIFFNFYITEYLTEIKMRYDILNKAGIKTRDHIRGLFLKKLTKSAIENANRWAHDNNPNPRSIKSCGT